MQNFGIETAQNVALGDISVYVGENIRDNTRAAFRKALSLIDSGAFRKAFVVNTTTGQRWALGVAREIDASRIGDDLNKDVICRGVAAGDLCNQLSGIIQTVERCGIDLIIINSWEFASANGLHIFSKTAVNERLLRVVTGRWASRVAPWWIRRRLGSKTMSDHQSMLQSIS